MCLLLCCSTCHATGETIYRDTAITVRNGEMIFIPTSRTTELELLTLYLNYNQKPRHIPKGITLLRF
jgi:hypothetical protein